MQVNGKNLKRWTSMALAWVLFLLLIALSGIIFATSKFWVFYREDVD